jgi:hypothetical protein
VKRALAQPGPAHWRDEEIGHGAPVVALSTQADEDIAVDCGRFRGGVAAGDDAGLRRSSISCSSKRTAGG